MSSLTALTPRGHGHQFVLYGDACSGVPDAPHTHTFAAINQVIQALSPAPEFIIFPGDEIQGLTTDEQQLRTQWRYWFDVEMAWLDRTSTPLYPSTSNHTTYDTMSERVFAEVHHELPRNGPGDQLGLSYYVRRDNLLLVFVNTCFSGLGGEGTVERQWLEQVLNAEQDAEHKFVIGHHPVFPVNGFAGAFQRELGAPLGEPFWALLVEHQITAYLCSHLLAFDVQVHDGVLQILSAGAGTAHRMPEGVEYLHCVQMCIDGQGLRYQVLDQDAAVREQFSWPMQFDNAAKPFTVELFDSNRDQQQVLVLDITGQGAAAGVSTAQTFLSGFTEDTALPCIWLGVSGVRQQFTLELAPNKGRSPHYWFGPELPAAQPFHLQVALHTQMGPGGILWRWQGQGPWHSCQSASPWGLENVPWPQSWNVGCSKAGRADRPFVGHDLRINARWAR